MTVFLDANIVWEKNKLVFLCNSIYWLNFIIYLTKCYILGRSNEDCTLV